MWSRTSIVAFACALLCIVGEGWAKDHGDAVTPESLLFQEIDIVYTATRTERSVREVPSSVTVIAAEEIHASGATSLEELLQTVPGLDLMRISRADLNVKSRGFVAPSSSYLLVMIDGRSVYLDFFGVTLWEQLNVTLHDIERIEVVRGPGSALYGANAFLGTINIVTKRPRDLPRLYTRTGVGTRSSLVTSTGAMATDEVAIKGSVQYRALDDFRNSLNPATNTARTRHDTGPRSRLFNTTLEYTPSGGPEIRLSGGTSRAHGDILTGVGTFDYDGPISYAKVDLRQGDWKFQAFYTRTSLDLDTVITSGPATPGTARLLASVLDFDLQRGLEFGDHEVLVGLSVRRLETDSRVILGAREKETLYSGFLQDELSITDRLTAFVGARFDDHPLSGFAISPRAALVYKLSETSRLRASFARSFQNPTQILNYSSYAASPFITISGNKDLDPVWATAYELGLHMQPHPRVKTQVDLFYNIVEDFQTFTTLALGVPTTLGFLNSGRTRAYGGEASVDWRWLDSLRTFANYSYQTMHGPNEESTPTHKATLGLRGRLMSFLRYSLTSNYVSHTDFEAVPLVAAGLPDTDIPSRFTVDAFLGVQVRAGVELGLHARNLFHQVREQHPFGDEIGSEFMLTLTGQF